MRLRVLSVDVVVDLCFLTLGVIQVPCLHADFRRFLVCFGCLFCGCDCVFVLCWVCGFVGCWFGFWLVS